MLIRQGLARHLGYNIVDYICVQYFELDTILQTAAFDNDLTVMKYLAAHGANFHADDDVVLKLAAMKGSLKVIQYLVSLGANVRARDDCILYLAVEHNQSEVIKYLVSLGADIHIGRDLCMNIAIAFGYLDLVRYLESCGAKLDKDNWLILNAAAKNGCANTFLYSYVCSKGPFIKWISYWIIRMIWGGGRRNSTVLPTYIASSEQAVGRWARAALSWW